MDRADNIFDGIISFYYRVLKIISAQDFDPAQDFDYGGLIYQVFKVDLAQDFGYGLVKSVDSLCPSFAVVTRKPRHSFLGCIRVLCTLHGSVGMRSAVATLETVAQSQEGGFRERYACRLMRQRR